MSLQEKFLEIFCAVFLLGVLEKTGKRGAAVLLACRGILARMGKKTNMNPTGFVVSFDNRACRGLLFKFNDCFMANILTHSQESMVRRISRLVAFSSACAGVILAGATLAQAEEMAPLNIKLPNAAFVGTKTDVQTGPNVEPLQTNAVPFMAPKDVTNLAAGKKVTCSDEKVAADKLVKVTDGDKGFESDSIVLVRKGSQWVQVDLGASSEIFAIALWHAHDTVKVYHDVIVQVSDTADFATNVKTIFNNDMDDSSKLGVGTDREYFETRFGKIIDAKGVKGRFVRVYSKGSSDSAMNEFTEVEVYGRSAK